MLLRVETLQTHVGVDRPVPGVVATEVLHRGGVPVVPGVQYRDKARGKNDSAGRERQEATCRHVDDARVYIYSRDARWNRIAPPLAEQWAAAAMRKWAASADLRKK